MGRVSSSIPKRLLTTIGDVIYASAVSNPARLASVASGQVLTAQGVGAAPAWAAAAGGAASKLITVMRDLTTISGNVAYTGAGFTPNSLIAVGGSIYALGSGACDSALTENGSWLRSDLGVIVPGFIVLADASGSQTAVVASLDADGFTLTWTKGGSSSGGYTVYVLCQA